MTGAAVGAELGRVGWRVGGARVGGGACQKQSLQHALLRSPVLIQKDTTATTDIAAGRESQIANHRRY